MIRLYNTGITDDLLSLRTQTKHLTQGSRNRYVKTKYKWKELEAQFQNRILWKGVADGICSVRERRVLVQVSQGVLTLCYLSMRVTLVSKTLHINNDYGTNTYVQFN